MKTIIKVFCIIAILGLALGLAPIKPVAADSVVPVTVLDPSWTAAGGGGVYSMYLGPDESSSPESPGVTTYYAGRESGIIKAGQALGEYWDEGLFAFIPNISINALAAGPFNFDVITQAGVNPVWMTIEVDTGIVGNRNDNVIYQYVPTTNPVGWHTVDGTAGQWQQWADNEGTVTGLLMSLGEVATANDGLNVVRAYLRLGMGNTYYNGGTGTTAWVDFVTIGTVTYDFQLTHPYTWWVSPTGSDSNFGTEASPFLTIQKAIDTSTNGDTINVTAGTYEVITALNINKDVTLNGVGNPLIQVSGTGSRIIFQGPASNGATLQGFWIEKTDTVGVQNIIYIAANNLTIQNNKIWGHYVYPAGDTSRAMEFTGGLSGLLIDSNEIFDLRQPAYINGVNTGTISNNFVYRTKGWVVAGGNLTFSNNTWGTGADANIFDIAILAGVGPSYYADVPAMSAANNGAVIEDQRLSTPLLSTVYVNENSTCTSDCGGPARPYSTITAGIERVLAGGTVYVAEGTYTEALSITKSLNLIGAGKATTTILAPANLPASSSVDSAVIGVIGSGVNAEITGFSVSGPGPTACGSIKAGIFVRGGAYANIHDNNIVDIRDNATPLSGCQNGIGILVGRQADATTGTATIANNTIVDYQKGGIVVDNAGSNAIITHNILTGAGTIDITAQNGIQISRGATATLTDNTITGNSYHNDANVSNWGATGVLLWQSGAVTFGGGNVISGNDSGVYIGDVTGPVIFGAETFGAITAPLGVGYIVYNDSTYPINLSSSTFNGVNFITATPDQILPFAAYIWDGLDESGLGIATLKSGYLFVDAEGSIQAAINAAVAGNTVLVGAGTYDEDVNVNKTLSLIGAGAGTTTIRGIIGGDGATVRIAANNVTVSGFTITRIGNNLADWDNPGLNFAGIAIQGATTGSVIQNNTISGNRTGLDINNSSGHSILDNLITDNRTGLLFRNQTDNLTVTGNDITNNWTVGVLFLDASNGTNVPVQSALNSHFNDNNLNGNWYGQVVDRQTGGSLPLPGTTNLKNFVENWWGTTTPVVSTANSAEPGYSLLIPEAYGGTSVAPDGQPDILGTASANIVFWPLCSDVTCATYIYPPVHNTTKNTYYFTIQAAIDAATPGDIIMVAAGTYKENVIVNKSVEIFGAGQGSTIVIPAISGAFPAGCVGSICAGSSNVFLVQANNVIIHDLTIDGDNPDLTSGIVRGTADLDARNGIITNHSAGTFNNLEIYDVTVQNIYLRGIYPSSGGTFNIHDNTVTNVRGEYASIALFGWGGPGTFANNTVSYANDAISANWSKGISFLNNTVTQSNSGIHTDNAGSTVGSVADLIQGNTIDCTGVTDAYGIFVFAPYIAPTVDQNTVTNCAAGLTAFGQTASTTGPVVTQFTNNILTGNGAAGSTGVLLTSILYGYDYTDVYATFTGNTITGFETGVQLWAGELWGWTPWTAQTIGATFNDNQIYGNTINAAKDDAVGATYTMDFSPNWWGTINKTAIQSKISGDIVWEPFWLNEEMTLLSGAVPTVYVDDDYTSTDCGGHFCGYDAFATLQEGIAAIDAGGTVNVAAGTYPEVGQIVIDKNLTIVGADKLTTIITPTQNTGGTYSGDARGWFLVQSGVTFNLSNVTLDGAGKLISIGILSKGTGTIENNILKNIGYNPSGPDYAGRGIAVYNANMIIRNNLLQNIGRIGIYMYGTGITAGVIDGNTYVGKGEGNWLDYGIEIEGGAVVEVKNNVISDCLGVASVDGSGSAGLLITTYFAGGSTANIHDNTFSGNSVGVYVGYDDTDTSSVVAHQNKFIGNEFGIVSTNPLVVADRNYWGTNAFGLIEAQIDGNVTFEPYWLDEPMSILSGTLVTPVFVDDDYAAMIDCGAHICGYDAFATVEDGVAAVTAGGIVNVAAGTYNPPATIALNKALSILGPTTGEAIVSGVGGATVKVFEISESHVTIQDLTITLATAPTVNLIGLIHVPDKAITDINITDNVIYVAPQSGAMSTWFAQAVNIGRYVTDSTISRNTIYNTRGGLVVSYNAALTIADNVIYNTKGGIMNYTGSAADAANRVMTNNSWNDIHNEWDIVWNSGGGPYDLDEHELVLLMSQANNDAYIVSQVPTVYTTPAQLIYGNRSHVFVNAATGTTTIKNDNGNMNVPYAKIQDGIDGVVPGGKVFVAGGTYVDDLEVNKALSLIGPNADINPNDGIRVAEAVIHPSSSYPNPDECTVMAYLSTSNISIKGFTFDGDNPAMNSGIMINGADVNACEILAGYEGMGNIVVENNILKNSTYSAIDFYNYTNSAATAGNYIRYNLFKDIGETTYNWGIGVLIYNNFYADITDNVFESVRTGVQTGNFSKANPGTTGSISNNEFNVWRLGIFHNLWYSNASTITISDNTINAVAYPGVTKWNGMLISSIGGTVNTIISDNDIVIPGTITFPAPGYTAGYNVWNTTTTAPLTISGGSVTGGDHGVFVNNFEGYSSNANDTSIILTGIHIDGAAIAGISIWDSPLNTNGAFVTAELHRNVITNSTQGVLVTGTDATVTGRHNQITATTLGVKSEVPSTLDLEENWWGSAVKSDFQAKIDGSVDYNPWCGNPECTTLVYEVTPGFTIQGAIDAASAGDMINVAAGTYPENITINKALTLTGANNATTIINGGGTGVVAQITADNVIFQGFTVQGSGTTDPQTQAGLTLAGADNCMITGNIFTNNMNGIAMVASTGNTISNNTVNANMAIGIALADLAGYPASTGNIISGNTVTANGAAGIYAGQDNNNNQYLTNTITGNGDGLYFWKSSNNTVTGNTISGNTQYGVHLMGSANNNIAGNIISGNLEGIRVRTSGWPEGAYPSTPNTIFHNQITGNTNYALNADANLVPYMAEANWWGAKTGPAAGTVTSNVDFSQWCGDVACTRLYPILTGIPENTLTTWDKTYNWTGTPGASWYILNVRNATGALIKNIWVSAADAQCNTDTSCSYVIPSLELVNGLYSWRVEDYGAYGHGLWTEYKSFVLNVAPINTPLSPLGTMTSWDKTFQWTGNTGAAWYILNVRNASDVLIKNIWVSAADAQCASDTSCSFIIPNFNLVNGSYSWRVLNYGGYGYGQWTAYQPFVLSILPLNTLVSPVTTMTSWDKTFQWIGNSGATQYIINVKNASGALIKNIWVSPAVAQCASDTSCTYIIPNFNLANGSYSWRVQNYGAYGYGQWTAYQPFVLNILPLNTLVSPLGTVTGWDKTFQWTGNTGATQYIINVKNASGALIKNIWVSAAVAQCASDTSCTYIIPNFNLANGSYSWRVQNYGAYGLGQWTEYQDFLLQ